jgi:iron complex transport system substrate-binding protein
MRVISLCPSNTEILFALGAGPEVVAVERWSDYPPAAASLPRVGTELDVDVELVRALEPDLVLASLTVPGMERVVAELARSGLPHLVLDPHDLKGIFRDIEGVGRAIGRQREAADLIARLREEIAAAARLNSSRRRPARVYLEWWPEPLIAPGARCWTREMIQIAGGRSLFAERECRSGRVESAEVVARDPELILLCWCGTPRDRIDPAVLQLRHGWDGISAVKHAQVYVVEEGWYGRPGPRVTLGIRQLAEWITAFD